MTIRTPKDEKRCFKFYFNWYLAHSDAAQTSQSSDEIFERQYDCLDIHMSAIPIASIYFSNIFSTHQLSRMETPHTPNNKQSIADYIFNDIFSPRWRWLNIG